MIYITEYYTHLVSLTSKIFQSPLPLYQIFEQMRTIVLPGFFFNYNNNSGTLFDCGFLLIFKTILTEESTWKSP